MMRRAFLVLLATIALAPPVAAKKLEVVASFSILGDMVARVGGDGVAVTTLIGPNGDAHTFEPTPAHARSLAAADIVFANGLGFEPWLDRLAKSTKTEGKLVRVAKGVAARAFHGDDGHGHSHAQDPHAWQDVRNAVIYTTNIAEALAAKDPANATRYRANAEGYAQDLRALDAEIRASLAAIPKDKRRVITSHDAFGYFANAYNVEFLAPLGTSTEAQASAKGVARLITQIRRENIKAVFVENISDPRLIEQIARETGVKVGGKLYSDALSPKDGPAPGYVAMMRHNTRLLTAAMASGS
jgi:zinc/manganese transport system substrate-binding protein